MKRISFITLLLMLFTVSVFPQVLTEALNNYDEGFRSYDVTALVSSTDTVYTAGFKLGNSTKLFDVFAMGDQANDSVKFKIVRQVSYFGTGYITERTVGTDSVSTEKAWADTSTYYNVVHKLAIIGVTGNGKNTSVKIRISAKRE